MHDQNQLDRSYFAVSQAQSHVDAMLISIQEDTMIRITNTSSNHLPSAAALPSQPDNSNVSASSAAHPVVAPEAPRSNRPPSPYAGAIRRRLVADYAIAQREFTWELVILGYAVQTSATDFLSLIRTAPGGIHGRDGDGRTLVEAAVREPVPMTEDLLQKLRWIGADFTLADENGNTLLHRLVMAQNTAAVERLLDCDVDVNASNQHTLASISRYAKDPHAAHQAMQRPNWYWGQDDNATSLHLAGAFGNPALIRLLAERGAQVDSRNRDRLTPLHWALLFSDEPENVRALLEAGANVNGPAAARCPPLHPAAMSSNNAAMIPLLIEHGADIDAKDENGQNAVHKATFNAENLHILSKLLAQGANPHALDNDGLGAAELAVFNARAQTSAILKLLNNAGVDLALPDRNGNTMLHRAAMYGNETAVRALLENGADANALNRLTTPDVARYAKNPAVAAQALRHPHLPWDEKDIASPLHLVAATGTNPALVKAFVDHGADINLRNAGLCTPLDWAAVFSSSPDMIRALLEHGADNTSSNGNQQPLLAAAMYSRTPEILTALIEGGADVNARSRYGTTPLIYASLSHTSPDILRTLLRHGADPTISGFNGETPLHTAAAMPYLEKVIALIEAGADITATDADGNTPLSLAQTVNSEHPEIAQLLMGQLSQRQRSVRNAASAQRRTGTSAARHPSNIIENPEAAPSSTTQRHHAAEMEADLLLMLASGLDSLGGNSDVAAELRRAASNTTNPSPDMLAQDIERWYDGSDRAGQPARAVAWRAIRNEPHAEEFQQFLAHLHETAEFRHAPQRPDYIQRVARLLTAIQNNPELRQQCFLLVEDATTSCGDRVGLTLNNLDMALFEHEAEHGQHSAQDLINIRTSQFRVDILNELAQKKIALLRQTPGARIDEVEIFYGAVTLVAKELNLIGVSRSMLYDTYAHFSEDDKREALAIIAQRESRGDYVKFIAQWQPWQKQLRRLRPNDFVDLDQRVAVERERLNEQPAYTSENDYVELCRRMENMQSERLAFSLETWTRDWLVQNR